MPPPPASLPGSQARRSRRASRLLRIPPRAATANTILLLFSRALSIPPAPLPAPLPSRAGRLIPRCTAGFRGETERASPAARRAGGRAMGASSPRNEARDGRESLLRGRPPLALFCSWPGAACLSPANHHPAAPHPARPRHLGGRSHRAPHAHLPPTRPPAPAPPGPASSAVLSGPEALEQAEHGPLFYSELPNRLFSKTFWERDAAQHPLRFRGVNKMTQKSLRVWLHQPPACFKRSAGRPLSAADFLWPAPWPKDSLGRLSHPCLLSLLQELHSFPSTACLCCVGESCVWLCVCVCVWLCVLTLVLFLSAGLPKLGGCKVSRPLPHLLGRFTSFSFPTGKG
nr:uncharacterized protein LOC108175905 [Oryctolagus cuniculus]